MTFGNIIFFFKGKKKQRRNVDNQVWKTKKLLYICPLLTEHNSSQKDYEKNISALEKKEKKQARFQRTHGFGQWKKSPSS